jgi:alanyl-tRNA synthetase
MPEAGLIVHQVVQESGSLSKGAELIAEVDAERRQAIRRNHTATHLLHASLREVVGTHVKQAGSLVTFDRLRFDFSHFDALTERALADIESLINKNVLADLAVESDVIPFDEALRSGAMALFGEKYGDEVRIIRVADVSLELCGGTHCARTGEIGLVKIVSERGIASGIRRIEAVSGLAALDLFREEHTLIRALEEQLSLPKEKLLDEFDRRMDQMRKLQREVSQQRKKLIREQLVGKIGDAEQVAGIRVFSQRVEQMDPQEMRELADDLRRDLRSGVVVLGRSSGGKASILVAVTDDLKKRLPAGDLVMALGKIIGGGGGGRPDMAEAGGKDPERLQEALEHAAMLVRQRMES